MKNFKKAGVLTAALAASAFALTGCVSQADTVSENLSTAADNFEIQRRIVFYNGVTGEYILEIQGLCSLGNNDTPDRLSVTCKVAPGNGEESFKKHFLGLSDNVTFFAEQVEGADVSEYYYKVNFKPQSIIPDVDFHGTTETPQSQPG